MKIIDKDIFLALHHFRTRCGSSNAEMGRRLELSKGHMSKIMNEKVGYFEDKTWERIEPILQPFIAAVKRSNVRPVDPKGWRAVPIISIAAADTINNRYLPEYVENNSDDEIMFPGALDQDFAIKITGDSMAPWYPSGTIVLCREKFPTHGKRVVVMMTDGTVLFKVFAQKEDKLYLMSINSKFGGKDFEIDENVQKVFPIVASIRNEDDIDAEMVKHGIKHAWKRRLEGM